MPVFQLTKDILFPPTDLAEPNGLLAVGGDLSPERPIIAYRQGIFPWYNEGEPILWWSPAPRLVLFPDKFHLPRRLARTIKNGRFKITADRAFPEVITGCAATPRKEGEGTWITREMQEAYCRLHELGFAHSVECWHNKKLVGGLYGICLDQVFFGESMFTRMSDGSKIALATLVNHALTTGIKLIDCQMTTRHLLRFGAREISGKRFQQLLANHISITEPQKKWRLH
ncbi:MAG: leucyl/phenylalanyl-tRNA--protein transferase [Desulfobulbaceae bacterium]|nr:leucyl/phenylalanyl-tRNA--protein transferase [Desulfobulbaceae bacterium]